MTNQAGATEPASKLRLLVQCGDQPGIVARVSQFLFAHGANIVQADQFSTDGGSGRFFMRVEFQGEGLDVDREALEAAFASEVAKPFEMEWRLTHRRKRAALLASRTDHCLLDLLWRWRRGELDVEIPVVISNHDNLRKDVETFGIPYHYLPIEQGKRDRQERAIRDLLEAHDVDLVVLARYMQVLSRAFIDEYPNRIINIHHSFLPAFAGADPYGRAFDRGVKIIGATAHYATEDLDEGPIIEQDVERVSHRDAREDLVRVGREVERNVLARAVQWHLEDRVFVYENRTVVFR